MAKIPRKYHKTFGATAGALQISKFGSLAAGAPVFSTDPEVIQALANYDQGWFSAILGNSNPTIEDMNALFYLLSYQMSYMFQAGVPEWNTLTTYYIGSVVNDGTGALYKSIQDGNTGHAVTDAAYWTAVTGGGSSGLTTQIITSTTSGVINKIYLCDSTSSAFGFVLPPVTPGAQVIVLDAGESAGTNAIFIAPVTGGQIGSLAVNGTLPLNTQRGGYWFFAFGTKWAYIALGATGGGGGSTGFPTGIPISGATTATSGNMYLATMGSAYALTLPGGTTAAAVGFLDAGGMSETNYLDITPATGQSIDTGAANEIWRARKAYTQGVLYRAAGSTNWKVQLQATTQVPPSIGNASLRLNTSNGYGSSALCIRRLINTFLTQGTGITYADSATLGASFTITETGLYSFSYSDEFSGASHMGLSKNAASLSTSIVSIPVAERLCLTTTPAANNAGCVSWTGYLIPGDVIRPHAETVSSSAQPARASFSAQQIMKG